MDTDTFLTEDPMFSVFKASAAASVRSMQSFHDRFGVSGLDMRTRLRERLKMLKEEVEEFEKEVEAGNYELALEEMADVEYVAMSFLQLAGSPGAKALQAVTVKNNEKTLETHIWDKEAGKIRRRREGDPAPATPA